MPLSVTRIF